MGDNEGLSNREPSFICIAKPELMKPSKRHQHEQRRDFVSVRCRPVMLHVIVRFVDVRRRTQVQASKE